MQPLITCLNFQVNYFMGKCLKSSRLRCQNNSDLSHLLYSNQQKSEQHRNQEKGFHTINQKEIKKLQQDTSQFSSTLSIPSFFLKGSSISPVSIFKERTCSFWTVYLFLRAIISKKKKKEKTITCCTPFSTSLICRASNSIKAMCLDSH